ncbi:MAG TPA: hypothetical protein VML55_25475 [Planctomycetaceae bacterium]|nr:hypothetical protein [Planctomycetaceae bacterium]
MRAPEEAGEGLAKVTYRFGAWKDVAVAPNTLELPVIEPPVEAPKPAASAR